MAEYTELQKQKRQQILSSVKQVRGSVSLTPPKPKRCSRKPSGAQADESIPKSPSNKDDNKTKSLEKPAKRNKSL